MKIGGFQKFSLLDYPGELSAIVFTQGCNFRCPYCHNPELVDPPQFKNLLDTEAVLRFLYRRRKKLSAVVISGGEPTLQEDLIPFVKLLKAMRFKVKLDTNGSLPDVLQRIIDTELVDFFAMDLKSPLPLYKIITKSEIDPDIILQSMELVRNSGAVYEFRNTFFDALLSTKDLAVMQTLLKPGDRFVVQECRYGGNLLNITSPQQNDNRISLAESSQYKSLFGWGIENYVEVSLRSL
ncbi:MAG: anaerobic ribonucleoside-triphosphate reductase activating protein [Candidatus Cloacimonetes bacterium]|nr:anaerobic ribonucleoside-triphosphate reductase activating protein [Candidatus Cloacimonadota bacterium]